MRNGRYIVSRPTLGWNPSCCPYFWQHSSLSLFCIARKPVEPRVCTLHNVLGASIWQQLTGITKILQDTMCVFANHVLSHTKRLPHPSAKGSVCMKATRILGLIFRKYYNHASCSSLLQKKGSAQCTCEGECTVSQSYACSVSA